MADPLNITQLSSAQDNKETTVNDSNTELAGAIGDFEQILVTNTNARTLTATEWTRNMQFSLEDGSPAPTATVTITVPATARGIFVVRNQLEFDAIITVASQPANTFSVSAKSQRVFTSDGTNVLAASADVFFDGASPLTAVERHIFIPAEGRINPTASGGAAALATVATSANQPDVTSIDFDQTTAEHAQIRHVFAEAAHAGNVSFQFVWSHASATTFGVNWNAKGVSIPDGDPLGVNFGTTRSVDDAGGTTDDHYLSPRTGFVKVATPADLDLVVYDLFRDPAAANDDLDADARLQGVILHYWENIPLDANWSSVSFMGGFDGEDAATDQDDESDNALAITYVNQAQIDTAQSKFSKSSLRVDGTGDVAHAPDDVDFDFGSGNFTIEAWVRYNSVGAVVDTVVAQFDSGASQRSWGLFRDGTVPEFRLGLSSNGTSTTETVNGAFTFVTNQWYHVAADFDGTTYRVYVDGVVIATSTNTQTLHNSTSPMTVGGASTTGGNSTDGWIDEVRVTKGVARYAGPFTPPTGPFPRG